MTGPSDATLAWVLLRTLADRVSDAADPGGVPLAMTVRVDGGGAGELELSCTADGTCTLSRAVADEALRLLELYLPLAVAPRFVVGQIGQSLDGRVATESGHSHYVTGREDIERLHRVRALVDAVVVGAGTVEADDPRLTVRRVEGDHPVRVVIDPRGRTAAERRIFTDGAARTLWVRAAEPDAAESTRRAAEVVVLPSRPDGTFEPGAVVAALAERGLRRVLVEGGGLTVSRFLEAGALDRLHVTVAPFVMGSGRHGLSLPPADTLDQVLRPRARHFEMGSDVLFDLDFGDAPALRLRVLPSRSA